MLTISRASVLLVLLAGFHSLAGAQINTGEIGGVVRDATGAAVPDAMVVGRHAATGALVQRQADGQGRFFLPALRPGEWELTATVAGASSPPRRIVVEIGQSLSVDLTFSVPGISEHVTVEAFSPLLQPTTSEISDVFDNRQVAQFPLNGRNFISLAQLSDAVVLPPGGTRGDSLQQAGPLPNVGGQRCGRPTGGSIRERSLCQRRSGSAAPGGTA